MGGTIPPPVPQSGNGAQSPATLDEIKHLYHSIYSPGLENFLESKWYPVKGVARLLSDTPLLDQFAHLLDQYGKTSHSDPASMTLASLMEQHIVWQLACMVRSAASENSVVKIEVVGIPAADDVVEANHRLTVFENLLSGVVADINPLTKYAPGSGDHHRLRELDFWYNLAKFVTLGDDEASSAKEMDETLLAMRNLLDGRENRDVLYSIAVVRSIGSRVDEYSDTDPIPHHLDEQDPKSKLAVAKKFIRDEAGGAGTTNVIRQFCDLAARSWIVAPPRKQ